MGLACHPVAVDFDAMNGPPRQRGSIRSVIVEGDDRTYLAEVRIVPRQGLRPGDVCWVEFGGSWAEQNGTKIRVAGVWKRCVILPSAASTTADVRVRFAPEANITITQA